MIRALIVLAMLVSKSGAGPVALQVSRMFKGDPNVTELVAQETNTSCDTGFRAGHTALVFPIAPRRWSAARESVRSSTGTRVPR
jgi:hypothetical protein